MSTQIYAYRSVDKLLVSTDNYLEDNEMSSKTNLNLDDQIGTVGLEVYNGTYIVVTREEVSDSADRRRYEMTSHDSLYRYCVSIDDENGGQEEISTHLDKFLALEVANKYSHKYSLPVMDATE
jgi:hypothetical protein